MAFLRRRFLGAAALAGAPLLVLAQHLRSPSKPKRIVWLGAGEQMRRHVREAFKARGIVEGSDVALIFQQGFDFQDEEQADALVRSRPDIIALHGDGALWPLRRKTRDIPMVFYNMKPDPVDYGLIESFARPGGNLTGSTLNATEWSKKLLEMLKRLVPSLKLVGDVVEKEAVDDFERAEPEFIARNKARISNINAQFGIDNVQLRVPANLRRDQIADVVKISGVQVVMFGGGSPEAHEFAVSATIPVVCATFAMAKKGCLLGWSFDWTEGVNYAVLAIQRILGGDSPAIVPVYQVPIAYALNRRRAREIGIEIPPELLIGARQIYD